MQRVASTSSPSRPGVLRRGILGPAGLDLYPLLLFTLALVVYLLYGFQRQVRFDEGLYTYAAQQMVHGVPFYVSTFDVKTPLSVFALAGGIWVGRLSGVDDLLAARVTNLIAACLCVAAVYGLGKELFHSRRAGAFAALSFLTFYTFGYYAASGPRAKTFMVLPLILSLWLGARRQWFWAGLFGALAALAWQPAGLVPLIMIVLACVQDAPSASRRLHRAAAAIAGVLLPLLATIGYFALAGGLRAAYEATVVCNLIFTDLGPRTLSQRLVAPLRYALLGYPGQWIIILLGTAMLGASFVGRLESGGGLKRFVAADPLAGSIILFPLFIAWSLVDVGSPTDLYCLLPFFAIGFGRLLDAAAGAIAGAGLRRPWQFRAFEALICLSLLAAAAGPLRTDRDVKLPAEQRAARAIERKLGSDGVLLTIDAPELLVLTHRTNPTRFVQMIKGKARFLDEMEPGGLAGWLQGMQALHPRLVATGKARIHVEAVPASVQAWLDARVWKNWPF